MLILFAFVLILADQPDFTAHTPAALPPFIASRQYVARHGSGMARALQANALLANCFFCQFYGI
jgi:hypothetical protein